MENNNKPKFDFSVLQEIGASFIENPVVEIIYGGKKIPVEIEVKPSEAFVSMESTPLQNNSLIRVVLHALRNNPDFKAKMNGKKVESISDVFDNEFEVLAMLDEDSTIQVLDMQNEEREKVLESNRISNRRIVKNCAVNPKFIDTEEFEKDKTQYALHNTFPIELIEDIWLQKLADVAIGKQMAVWGEKAEAIGKSVGEDDNTEFDAERSSTSDHGESMESETV